MRWISAIFVFASLLVFAAPAEAAPKVAVVDIVRCMEQHPETVKLEERRKAAVKKADDNLKFHRQRLTELERKMEMMAAEDPDRLLKQRQYELQGNSAKFNYEWDIRVAQIAYTKGLEAIYDAVRGQVARYARDNAIEIVLMRTDVKQPLNSIDPKDFSLKARLRVVVHADSKADITDAIVTILKGK